MQVVINSTGVYVSADADAVLAPDGVLYGEWHSETTGTGSGDRATGDGNDSAWFANASGNGFSGTLDLGDGNNTAIISGSNHGLSKAHVTAGTGADSISVTGGTHGMYIGVRSRRHLRRHLFHH